MYVKMILVAAAELIGEDAARSVREFVEEFVEEGRSLTEALLRCYQRVQSQLAADYLPIKTEEELETDTGAVPYKNLSKQALRIVKVTDEWGLPLRVDRFGEYFKTQVGRLKVVYTYLPKDKGIGDQAEVHYAVSKQLCAYGIAAEYCLDMGLYEEAAVWEKKYKAAIAAAYRQTPCKKIASRDWH